VFSASLPPYLASAAITAIDVIDQNPDMLVKLKQNVALLWKGLSDIKGMSLTSNRESPIVFLKLEKSSGSAKDDLLLLEKMADRVSSLFLCKTKSRPCPRFLT
jgi:serine palmitoyltransferase